MADKIQLLQDYLPTLAVLVVIVFDKFILEYFKQKGQNLATKEDIENITKKIESVKFDYAKQLESTKASLLSKISTHSYRYEKEYDALELLSGCLVDLRAASTQLRPRTEKHLRSQTEASEKGKRLKKLATARLALWNVAEKQRPFIPDNIYTLVTHIDKVAHGESHDYEYREPDDDLKEYWERAQNNRRFIEDAVESAMVEIRKRVQEWDEIQ